MATAFDEEVINAGVNRVIDYLTRFVDHTWEKSLNVPHENSTKTIFNATELDVRNLFYVLFEDRFNSILVAGIQKQPVQWGQMTPLLRAQYLERHFNYMNSTRGPSSTHTKAKNIDQILTFIRSVTENNCNNRFLTRLFS